MAEKEKSFSRLQMVLLFVAISLVAIVSIVVSMVKVQWVDGDMWREKAVNKSLLMKDMQAKRGNIYSSDGKLLATTMPVCDLYIDFSIRPLRDNKGNIKYSKKTGDTLWYTPIRDTFFIAHIDSAAIILHHAFPETSVKEFKRELKYLRDSSNHPACALIRKGMPYVDWSRLCKLEGWKRGIVMMMMDGTSVVHNLRFHTYGNLAESVIGFRYSYDRDEYSGLEGYYDSILRGQDGKVLHRRLTRGVWMPVSQGTTIHTSEQDELKSEEDPEYPVIDGSDIIATIDTRFQDIAHYSLESTLKRLGGSAGCAILMEVETGNILVSASLVGDTLGNYRENANRNVTIADIYEPGSIFKPVILTAMYNDPTVPLDTSMLLPVGIKQFSQRSEPVRDHGMTENDMYPLWKSVAISSNVSFCELSWRYYNDRRDSLLTQVKRIFPIEKLGVDLRGPEANCRTHSLISDNDFLRFNYGYTVAISPLRMATYYNALANGGKMVKPRFCKAIVKDGKVEELPVEVLKESICSKETANTIRDLLLGVVEGGTGDNIRNTNYSIAGKTGTAETAPKAKTSNVTFVGFFPAEKPKYTCLVMIRDVNSFGRNAAPVFEDIANCVVSMDRELDCRPSVEKLAEERRKKSSGYKMPTVTKAPQAEVRLAHKRFGLDYSNITRRGSWCVFIPGADSIGKRAEYEVYNPPQKTVPNCSGMTLKDALLLCREMGLDVTFEGYGKVVGQSPKSHTSTEGVKAVHLILK